MSWGSASGAMALLGVNDYNLLIEKISYHLLDGVRCILSGDGEPGSTALKMRAGDIIPAMNEGFLCRAFC